MNYQEEKIGDVLVVRIGEKRLDQSISSEFKTELLRLVESDDELKILIDLKNVDYADSSGLGALLFGLRQVKANSGKLKLLHLNPKVQTLINIAKLDNVMECFSKEEKALESFSE